jgi:sulfatase maturation enzyme AslB (radical SAM superfamily)
MDMDKDTAKKVVDTIFYTSNPNLTIEFQWWEALVNWEVVKYIVEYAEIKAQHLKKNVSFALVTNLTLMDDDKLDYIIDHNIHISTSLDWDEETHNFNRTFKDGNSFDKVTYWIKKINDRYAELDKEIPDYDGKVLRKVWALLTVTKKTLWKYKEVINTYVSLWLDWIFLRPLNPYWFAAADLKKLWYEPKEFIEFYKKSMDYIIELNKKWVKFREAMSWMYLSKILTDKDPNYLDERSPCWACIWQVAYNFDGKIYSCDEGRMLGRMWDDSFLMVDMKDTSFDEFPWHDTYNKMIDSETTKIMVQASTLDWLPGYNDSVYKPYIWVCPIHSYKSTWNIIPNYSKDEKRVLGHNILDYLFENIRIEKNKSIFKDWLWMENNSVTSQCESI